LVRMLSERVKNKVVVHFGNIEVMNGRKNE